MIMLQQSDSEISNLMANCISMNLISDYIQLVFKFLRNSYQPHFCPLNFEPESINFEWIYNAIVIINYLIYLQNIY